MNLWLGDFVEVRKTKERGRVEAVRVGDRVDVVFYRGRERVVETLKRRDLRVVPLEELL